MRLVLSRVEPADFDALVPLQFATFDDVDLNNCFFGPTGPAGYAYAKRTVLHAFRHDAADVWMKVTDEDVTVSTPVLDATTGLPTGATRRHARIVAGSNWKVWPTLVPAEHDARNGGAAAREGSSNFDVSNPETTVSAKAEDYGHVTWFEKAEEKRDVARILADFLARRRVHSAEAHVLCFLMFVDREYQRKGVGKMCMKWGTDLADQLMLPCWIEASPKGEGLYRQFGYEDAGGDDYGRGKGRVYLKTDCFLSEYLHMRRPTKVERLVGTELKRE